MIFCAPVKAKYMEKNLDITKPCLSERIWPVPWRYAESWFHCTCVFVQLRSVSEQYPTSCRFMFSSPNIIPQHKGVERQIYWRKATSNLPWKLQSVSDSPWSTSDMLSLIGWKQPLNRNFTPQITQFSFLKVCWPCVLCTYHLKTFGSDYLHSRQVKSTLVPEVFS